MSGTRFLLSYRREDSAGHAGRLADHLLDRFGAGSVFMDVESIEAGVDFTQAIEQAISDSDAILIVIGPGWLEATTADGGRRLDEPEDFVRREIEAALRSDVRVIPLLVGGATMPAEDRLPGSIGEFARRNAVDLQDRRWREDVDALVDVLEGRGKAVAGNLPAQPTPFLGRERELAEIVELVRRDDVRLLTLTGPGGIGKTRLAIQAASKLAHTYPGGAWFVGLAALTEPELVLAELAAVLEVQEGGGGSLVDALGARLSRVRTLVVLDNLEQLLPDAASPIAELSSAAPMLDLVVSSREPLHLAAERGYPVGAFSEDESSALFVERARAVRPDFEPLDDAEQKAIAQICTRLDRLPLAIELAASRSKVLSPGMLLQRLEQRLPLLTGGARDAPARQQTLRATIAWSYDLLSDDERALFERLAVFSGGFTLEAAEAICDADLDTLEALLERNLVRQEDGPGGRRYLMLETIREFALERLMERPGAETLRRRHADYLLEMAVRGHLELTGPDQARWVALLEVEQDNFRASLRWALDGPDPDLGLRLVVELYWVWFLSRPLSEIRRWLAEALERAPSIVTVARAQALHQAGFLAGEQGEEEVAVVLLEEAISHARQVGALAIEAFAMSNLANIVPLSRADEVVPLGEQAVRLARGSGDQWVLAITLNNLGESYRKAGDTDGAAKAYEESYGLLRAYGDRTRMSLLLGNLAEMAILANDLPRARTMSNHAFELAEALGDGRHASSAQTVLGWAMLAEDRPSEAAVQFAAGLARLRDLGAAQFALNVLLGLAATAAAAGDATRAARLEAVATSSEKILGHQPTAADSGVHLRYLDELRARTDPAVWEAAAREGAAMTLEEGIEFALSG